MQFFQKIIKVKCLTASFLVEGHDRGQFLTSRRSELVQKDSLLVKQGDDSYLAVGPSLDKETYTIAASSDVQNITGFATPSAKAGNKAVLSSRAFLAGTARV